MKKILHKEKDNYILRSFEQGEADKYFNDCFAIGQDEEVDRLTGSNATFDYQTIVNYHNRIVKDKNRYDFIIVNEQNNFIGECVLNEIDWETKSANFRVAIFSSKNCSKGVGSWAVYETIKFAFEEINLHRVELEVFSFNKRAKRVYEKVGFKVEGIKKDAILDGNKYADIIMMAILEDEWVKLNDRKSQEK